MEKNIILEDDRNEINVFIIQLSSVESIQTTNSNSLSTFIADDDGGDGGGGGRICQHN